MYNDSLKVNFKVAVVPHEILCLLTIQAASFILNGGRGRSGTEFKITIRKARHQNDATKKVSHHYP